MRIRGYPKKGNGFTLVEIVLVSALMVVLAGFGSIALNSFLKFQELESATREVILRVRDAQQRAITQEEGSAWGIRFVNNVGSQDLYMLFQGASYTVPFTTTFLHSRIEWETPPEGEVLDVAFAKISGETPSDAIITLRLLGKDCGSSPESCRTITVKENGVIQY